ncbi:hypothetical protein AVEN_210321-1 [Araneus ventricosus]|uniref:Uncharacterized protein n=1 Tax=Araneus ventricosus TaxID=182803 RepID=A0A4Y2JUQ4_ARAVE|nr:hypothetical protein AVEN_210321-1 [Araneus ventricosus]
MVGIPSGLKSERKIRGSLKEASEKNNALRRLKPCFEGSKQGFRHRQASIKICRLGKIEERLTSSCREGKKIAPPTFVQS